MKRKGRYGSMKFSRDRGLSFEEAVSLMFEKLGTDKIMALASSHNDYVMAVSYTHLDVYKRQM